MLINMQNNYKKNKILLISLKVNYIMLKMIYKTINCEKGNEIIKIRRMSEFD